MKCWGNAQNEAARRFACETKSPKGRQDTGIAS
jgi:hypothetical protein